MIKIISRPHNDHFTFSLFHELLSQLDCHYDAYYAWSSDILDQLHNTDFGKSPNVIFGIKDHLEPWGPELLVTVAQRFPLTNFVVLTSLENPTAHLRLPDNLHVISWGGDLTNQLDEYTTLDPVLDKNFQSSKIYIALNRFCRIHRVVTLSYIYATGLHAHGHLSLLIPDPPVGQPKLDFDQLWHLPRHAYIRDAFYRGHAMMRKDSWLQMESPNIYPRNVNDNVGNFNSSLRYLYRDSFVEIVSETTFTLLPYLLTEKTLNAFVGCNFPIILGGRGAVQHLRQLGFDMFDDVICHDYDNIWDPVDRIVMAIELNRGLLTDDHEVKEAWQQRRSRFLHNIEVIKTLDNQYWSRAQQSWNQIQWYQ